MTIRTQPRHARAARIVVEATRYLREQFPVFQAAALLIAGTTAFFLFDAIHSGRTHVSLAPLVAGATLSLLYLQVRILDDLDTYYIVGPDADIANATPRGLVAGEAVAAILTLTVNRGAALAAAATVVAVMVAAELVMRRWLPGFIAIVFGRIPLFDIAPMAAFAYVYVQWRMTRGATMSPIDVGVVVVLYWLFWEIWKFSRNIGKHDFEGIYRPYRLEWPEIRMMLVAMTVAAALLTARLSMIAPLNEIFVAGVALFSLWYVLLARPTGKPEVVRPWWRGLFYPGVMAIALFVHMIVLVDWAR